MDRLIFVSCGNTTLPLIPLLAQAYTVVLPDGDKTERLCQAGLRAMAWDALVDPATSAGLAAGAERIAEEWRRRLAAEAESLFAFGGRPRAAETLAAIDATLGRRLATQLAAREYGRTLARTGRLEAVIVHEDVTGPARAFLEGVRPFGVPTVHVPHGLYADDQVVGANVHGAVLTDLVAVGGIAQRAWFVGRGVDPRRVVVTGNPAWDRLCRMTRAPGASLGLAPGPVVTLGASWIGPQDAYRRGVVAHHERCLRAALEAVRLLRDHLPAVRLVLKLHPSGAASDEESLRRMAAAAEVGVDLVVRDRAPQVLAASDVLVTLPSTLAAEALLLGTPVVSPEFFYDGDAVLAVPATAEGIATAILRVLAGWGQSRDFAARRRDFLLRHNGPSDGRAAERVAHAVEALIAAAQAGPRVVRPAEPEEAAGALLRRHLVSGRTLLAGRCPASALVVCDAAPLAGAPPDVAGELWTLRGEALVCLRRAAEAEACFRRALAGEAPAAALAGLGLLLLERGEFGEAGVHLRRAAERDPDSDWAWCGLGVLAALGGDRATAVALLERALAINPANPDARSALDTLRGLGAPLTTEGMRS
jgi:tetratricopeptide (TPR) repeat protein